MLSVPVIPPVPPNGNPRPFWSVMIPAYNPSKDYLEQMLRSVLVQDPGPEQMQIEVVDDCSPDVDVAALVREIAGNRVKVSSTHKNLGLAGCWNNCIERSRGEWVHILHQDDWVLPEFYARFEALIQAVPGLDAAYSRHFFADADGHWTAISSLEMRIAGELKGFDKMIATWQQAQCAAVIVKCTAYERLGGYRSDLPYVLDWEMWCRIAASGRWGYVPQPGAAYRSHPQSETERLRSSGKILREFLAGGLKARENFSRELQDQTAPVFQDTFAGQVLKEATALYVKGCLKDAGRLLNSFRKEMMRSNYRRQWLWLRLRVFVKPFRKLKEESGNGQSGHRPQVKN
ncbi:MAG TPA: glycosyltransferase [Candidatus Saccharimonadales bacterium]|nr:glycosyltransferase [Candidatus Saccharimonadales bacterium]